MTVSGETPSSDAVSSRPKPRGGPEAKVTFDEGLVGANESRHDFVALGRVVSDTANLRSSSVSSFRASVTLPVHRWRKATFDRRRMLAGPADNMRRRLRARTGSGRRPSRDRHADRSEDRWRRGDAGSGVVVVFARHRKRQTKRASYTKAASEMSRESPRIWPSRLSS